MSESEPLPVVSTELQSAAVSYEVSNSTKLVPNDGFKLFVGDYQIGYSGLSPDPNNPSKLIARINIDQMPIVDWPAELRSVWVRTGTECGTPIMLRNANELMKLVGPPKIKAILTSAQDDRISFELEVDTLPSYPRELAFRVNGVEWSQAWSSPREGGAGAYAVNFPARSQLRDGASLEILDLATGAVIFSTVATWINLIGPVLESMKRLHSRYNALEQYLRKASARIDAIANVSRERQTLDRLDLFYFLINDRLDREMRWITERGGFRIDEQTIAGDEATIAAPSVFTVKDVDGIGMYQIEANGVSEWRWFSSSVTTLFRNVQMDASVISLHFSSVAPGVDLAAARITVNGFQIETVLCAETEEGYEVTVPIPSGSVRSDKTIILHVQFDRGHTAEGDSRTLTAAFTGAEIFL